MQKSYIILALVLWGFAQTVGAQNMYRNYQNFIHPKTTASIVHSSGYVYFFQSDGLGYLSVSEIDPLSMNPTGNDKSCDNAMWHVDKPTTPKQVPHSLNITPLQQVNPTVSYGTSAPDFISVYYVCDETYACSHQHGGKSLKQDTNILCTDVRIFFEDNRVFVCEGFDGEIQYSLYDVAGKLLHQGSTHNQKRNVLYLSGSIYILKAKDSEGNQVVKKIVLL